MIWSIFPDLEHKWIWFKILTTLASYIYNIIEIEVLLQTEVFSSILLLIYETNIYWTPTRYRKLC